MVKVSALKLLPKPWIARLKMKAKLPLRLKVNKKQGKLRFYRGLKKLVKWGKNPRLCLATALFSLVFLITIGPLKFLLDRDFLLQQVLTDPCCQVILYVLLFVVLTILGIPGTILVIAGGIVFGLFWGTIWSVIGATLGALGAFWTARYLLRNYTKRKFGKNKTLAKFDRAVVNKPFTFVFIIRLIPLSPFNLENYLFALTPVHWIPYILATFLGIIPGTLAYTWLGVTGDRALREGDILPFFVAIGFLIFLSVLPICLKKNI